jgi:phage baseplate assembly protein W
MSRWVELAQFNNLKHPYIVDAVNDKMENPDHLVTVGDTLLIQMDSTSQSSVTNNVRRNSEYNQEELYALALGKDLDLLPIPESNKDISHDSEVLEMKGNDLGDIATIKGVENLKQSLFIRLITPKGSYLGHPSYGSKVYKYLGKKNTEENATLLDLEIERTLRSDKRVTHVMFNRHEIKENTYSTSFTITATSVEEAFEFVISAQNDGPIVLRDNFYEG